MDCQLSDKTLASSVPSSLHRGQYGPYPEFLVTKWRLRRSRFGLALARIALHRPLTWLFPLSRLKSVSERKLIDAAQGAVEFQLLRPSMTPLGYRLAHLDLVPGCRDLATFVFLGPRDRSFVLSQRPCYVPLTAELELAHQPFTTLSYQGRTLHVVHGAYGGEPIDGSFWVSTRRSLAWEQKGLICEVRQVLGRSPRLTSLLRFAMSVGP